VRASSSRYLDSLRAAVRDGRAQPPTGAAAHVVGVYLFVLAYSGFWWYLAPDGLPRFYFDEGGPIDSLSTVFLAAGAILAGTAWLAARGRDDADRHFWLLGGAGLAFLTLDERMQIHERLQDDWLEPTFGALAWKSGNWNDLVVILYGLVAVGLLLLVLPGVLRHRATRNLLAVGVACYVMHVTIDLLFGGVWWKNCVEESFKLLAGASFMLAFLQPVLKWRSSAGPSMRGLGVSAAFLVATFGVAGVMLFGREAWPEFFVKRWGDPVRWLGMTYLGAAALFFSFTRIPGSALARVFRLLSTAVFAVLTLGEITVAAATIFWLAVRRKWLEEVTVAKLRILDQGFSVRTLAVVVILAGLVALAYRLLPGRRQTFVWLLFAALSFMLLVTIDTLTSIPGDPWPMSLVRLTGCATALLAAHGLLTHEEVR
jgi:hypothetical protein